MAWLAVAVLLLCCGAVGADPAYPSLTGRVVDNANVIGSDAADRLNEKLKALEDRSGIQLVVATMPTLGGAEIEPFANGLFRFWKLGEAKNNNGVLLLVAPKERRVRIEVGYGLEGTLTDAIAKLIITNAMAPRFKAGDFAGGIERSTDDIITVLTTDSADWEKRPKVREDGATDLGNMLPLLLVIVVITVFVLRASRRSRSRGSWGGGPWIIPPSGGSWGGSGGGGFSGGGGGFSGGGGSSGGGGASGSW